MRIGRAVAEAGYTYVTGNNRGHDVGTWIRPRDGETRLAGGAWEMFDESPRDIAGWIDFAVGLGFPRVVLLGHSLGALKVAYYQGARQDPRVIGLIAASPPVRAGWIDPDMLATAEKMVADGRGLELIHQGVGGPFVVSAQTRLNRYRADVDVYGFFRPPGVVAAITCPILALYGSEEPNVGTEADLATIRRNATRSAGVTTAMIAGADHVYTAHEADTAAVVVKWLGKLGNG
jgi:pimeloyl-ACP methyl ester carboxylesterase